jgi:hypothetical protein
MIRCGSGEAETEPDRDHYEVGSEYSDFSDGGARTAMSDDQGSLQTTSPGGVTGDHADASRLQLFAGTSTDDQFNTARLPLVPIACWSVDDIRFAFDSSFVDADCSGGAPPHEDIRHEMELLKVLADTNQGCPLSLFGHADPVGSDVYNKSLSERRAKAIYALLIFKSEPDVALGYWQGIASAESWGTSQKNRMQSLIDANGSSTDGGLMRAYMKILSEPAPVLSKTDFLAQGTGGERKGDFQGCSEFNPLVIFSQEKQAEFDQARTNNDTDGIARRNAQNAQNRRVLGLFFRKGSKVDPAKWPCPRASEGIAGCVKRFWSDGETRRSTHLPNRVDRHFDDKQDTFACRFYQRLAADSPCETATQIFLLQIRDFQEKPLAGEEFRLQLAGPETKGTTDANGFMRLRLAPNSQATVKVQNQTYQLGFQDSLPLDVLHAQALLNALGYNSGPLDGILGRRTQDALKSYQRDNDLEETGKLDDPTNQALRTEQIIFDSSPDAPAGQTQSFADAKTTAGASKSKSKTAQDKPGPVVPPTTTLPLPLPPADPTPAAPTPGVIKVETVSRIDLPPPHDELSECIARRFNDIDIKDANDGFLSKDDINKALGDDTFLAKDGAMVATIKKFVGDFEEFSDDEIGWENDGITLADVTAYDRRRLDAPSDAKILKIQNMYNYAKQKIAGTASALFVGNPDPLGVNQGMIGDCWFLAALVAVGLRNPDDIKKMVSKQFETFVVQFPGRKGQLLVTKPTDGELAIFSTVGSNGIWLPVLEKAYGSAVNKDALFFVDNSTTDAADGGDHLPTGIQLMTGNSSTSETFSFTRMSKIRKLLIGAFANKKIVTAGIDGAIVGSDFRPDGLPMGHAYTVISYDSTTDKITVRNPWGNTGPRGVPISKGVFQMTLDDFATQFSIIAFED